MELIKQKQFSLVFLLWFGTVPTALFGIWKDVTTILLPIIAMIVTLLLTYETKKEKYYNIKFGIFSVVFSNVYLLASYKLAYSEFKISVLWLLLSFFANILLALLHLWLFIRGGKKIASSIPVYIVPISLMSYPIINGIIKSTKMSNNTSAIITIFCLLVISLIGNLGVRSFFIQEDSGEDKKQRDRGRFPASFYL